MKKFDFVIAGQGLAGTVLGYTLEEKGASVYYVNQAKKTCSSSVAAGIFNPITGKKMVLTWSAEKLFPYLTRFYQNLEKHLGTSFFYPLPLIRPYASIEEQNYWEGRMSEKEIQKFVHSESIASSCNTYLHAPFGGFEIDMAGWVDLPVLLKSYYEKSLRHNIYEEGAFEYHDLKESDGGYQWNGVEAKGIIFCEGSASVENPFFNWLPFSLSRGDILTIESDELPSDKIVNKGGVFVVPIGGNKFRTGSTYERHFTDPGPSEKGKKEILEKLEKILKVPFTVIAHHSGVRPAVRDRRPLLGAHPERKNMYIFNGLGAKGVSLAPYFAEELTNLILFNKEPDIDVNIRRFYTLYKPASQS
ncbi:FAD-dependent oxidoreductase [Cytophagaceae bacterium ABcell3]|nr:FAD-dependent oxidoreductase [Cytophagaceae bacterium ABcell3]